MKRTEKTMKLEEINLIKKVTPLLNLLTLLVKYCTLSNTIKKHTFTLCFYILLLSLSILLTKPKWHDIT